MGEAPRSLSPARVLLAAALFCIALSAIAAVARLRQPSLGLALTGDSKAEVVRITGARGPNANVAAPSVLVSIAAGDRSVKLKPADVIEEPDFFDTYAEMADFFARQSELDAILAANEVTLTTAKDAGEPPSTVTVRPTRPSIGELPGRVAEQLVQARRQPHLAA